MFEIATFIKEIKKRRPLWDPTNKLYHNKLVLTELWKEVATAFHVEVPLAKQKWKNLRDTFRVEVKKCRKQGFDNDPVRSSWSHYEEMLFLKDLLKTRKLELTFDTDSKAEDSSPEFPANGIKVEHDITFSPSRLEDDPETEAIANQTEDFTSVASLNPLSNFINQNYSVVTPGQKRKRNESEEDGSEDEDDADLLFFRSLLPYVKKLSQEKKLMFRMNVQQALYSALYNKNN